MVRKIEDYKMCWYFAQTFQMCDISIYIWLIVRGKTG